MSVIITLLIIFAAVTVLGVAMVLLGGWLSLVLSEGWLTLAPIGFFFGWVGGIAFMVTLFIAAIKLLATWAGVA